VVTPSAHCWSLARKDGAPAKALRLQPGRLSRLGRVSRCSFLKNYGYRFIEDEIRKTTREGGAELPEALVAEGWLVDSSYRQCRSTAKADFILEV
jgi:hypothetical protein